MGGQIQAQVQRECLGQCRDGSNSAANWRWDGSKSAMTMPGTMPGRQEFFIDLALGRQLKCSDNAWDNAGTVRILQRTGARTAAKVQRESRDNAGTAGNLQRLGVGTTTKLQRQCPGQCREGKNSAANWLWDGSKSATRMPWTMPGRQEFCSELALETATSLQNPCPSNPTFGGVERSWQPKLRQRRHL